MVRASRFLARTEIPLIVDIDAICDGMEAPGGAQILHQGEELIFAEEAALRVIANILRATEFRSCDHLQGNRLLLGEGDRVGKLRSRQTRRVGDDCQHIFWQRLMGCPRQVGRIHASGIGDKQASCSAQAILQQCALSLEVRCHG